MESGLAGPIHEGSERTVVAQSAHTAALCHADCGSTKRPSSSQAKNHPALTLNQKVIIHVSLRASLAKTQHEACEQPW